MQIFSMLRRMICHINFFFKKRIPNYASKAMIIKACNITEIRGLGPNIAFVKCHTSCTEDL